jgi:hypothetical protein
MSKKILVISGFIFLYVISSISCAAAKPKQEEAPPYVASFNYTSASQAAAGSAGVAFAVAGVTYNSDKEVLWPTYPQFINLDKAIKDDLTKLLTAKGFSMRGPFDSYDLVSYPEKKTIDFWLVPTMELLVTLKDRAEKVESVWAAPSAYILSGNAEINGKMILEFREIVTKELMWSKTIPFTDTFPYSVRIVRYNPGLYIEGTWNPKYGKPTPFNYALIMDGVAKVVEKHYPDIMATISKLIDPEEMMIIKKQCQELKSKKGY